MQIISGTVRYVRYTSEINASGGGNYFSASTTHCALVELHSGQRIKFASADPAFLREGDTVSFAGTATRRGIFFARAYRNDTAGVSGDDHSHWYALTFGILFTLLCPMGAMLALSLGQGVLVASLILAVGAAGVLIASYGVRTWKIVKSLGAGGAQEARQPLGAR